MAVRNSTWTTMSLVSIAKSTPRDFPRRRRPPTPNPFFADCTSATRRMRWIGQSRLVKWWLWRVRMEKLFGLLSPWADESRMRRLKSRDWQAQRKSAKSRPKCLRNVLLKLAGLGAIPKGTSSRCRTARRYHKQFWTYASRLRIAKTSCAKRLWPWLERWGASRDYDEVEAWSCYMHSQLGQTCSDEGISRITWRSHQRQPGQPDARDGFAHQELQWTHRDQQGHTPIPEELRGGWGMAVLPTVQPIFLEETVWGVSPQFYNMMYITSFFKRILLETMFSIRKINLVSFVLLFSTCFVWRAGSPHILVWLMAIFWKGNL